MYILQGGISSLPAILQTVNTFTSNQVPQSIAPYFAQYPHRSLYPTLTMLWAQKIDPKQSPAATNLHLTVPFTTCHCRLRASRTTASSHQNTSCESAAVFPITMETSMLQAESKQDDGPEGTIFLTVLLCETHTLYVGSFGRGKLYWPPTGSPPTQPMAPQAQYKRALCTPYCWPYFLAP